MERLPKQINGEVVAVLFDGDGAEIELFRQTVSFKDQRDAYYLLKHLRGISRFTWNFEWDFEKQVMKNFIDQQAAEEPSEETD